MLKLDAVLLWKVQRKGIIIRLVLALDWRVSLQKVHKVVVLRDRLQLSEPHQLILVNCEVAVAQLLDLTDRAHSRVDQTQIRYGHLLCKIKRFQDYVSVLSQLV